jgi:nicotinamide-nucleotide amidase
MRAEVISIGDELTSGQRLDTNSQWLSERLGELGVAVRYHTTVGDELAANVRVFREAASRVELIVCTGGLGPTADDLTRDALAEATGRPLVQDAAALAHIEQLFARRSRPMPERNRVQALFPAGARVIPNPHGTAPGIDVDIPTIAGASSRLFALPGVPAEMREMWFASVAPAIRSMHGDLPRLIKHKRVKCFGVGESDLEAMLPDLIRRGREPLVGITVHEATITLRITAEAESDQACDQLIAPTLATIRQLLGDLVFGEDDDELPQAVGRLLTLRRATVAAADGSGLLAQWLCEAAPDRCAGGVIAASPARLAQALDLPAEMALPDKTDFKEGAALAMAAAQACRSRFQSDYALVLLPFAESTSQSPPLRLAGAIADKRGPSPFFAPLAGHPEIVRPRAAKHALDVLRKALLSGAE